MLMSCMTPPWAGVAEMVLGSGSVLLLDLWQWMQCLLVWFHYSVTCRVRLHIKSFVPV